MVVLPTCAVWCYDMPQLQQLLIDVLILSDITCTTAECLVTVISQLQRAQKQAMRRHNLFQSAPGAEAVMLRSGLVYHGSANTCPKPCCNCSKPVLRTTSSVHTCTATLN